MKLLMSILVKRTSGSDRNTCSSIVTVWEQELQSVDADLRSAGEQMETDGSFGINDVDIFINDVLINLSGIAREFAWDEWFFLTWFDF